MRGLHQKLIVTLLWATCTSAKDGKKSSSDQKRCYGELGCFGTGGPFYDSVYRPVNVFPEAREHIDTRFAFYTHVNPKREEVLTWSSTPKEVAQIPFNASRGTKVLAHGWIDTVFFGHWMEEMKDSFLVMGDYNVIIVDWRGGNALPYLQAVANTRVVGAEIALLVNKLEKAFGAKPESFHILGHSLGAHVAGYAGERLPRLGRITGLDPADPYYRNMPREVRLDPTDARFVDVIHTDGGSIFDILRFQGLGMSQPTGHVDFYPNGGRNMPGCSTSIFSEFFAKGSIRAARSMACNHERAVSYFLDSITESSCTSIAFACTSFEDFRKGKCADCGHDGRLCARMGFHADEWKVPRGNSSRQMYLFTSDHPPYCAFPFLVNIRLRRTGRQPFATGYFVLILHGTKGKAIISINKGPLRLYGGVKNTFVVKTHSNVGEVLRASFRFKSSRFFLFRKNMLLRRVDVMPMNEPLKTGERKKRTLSFCLSHREGIPSGAQVQLSPCKLGSAP